MPRSATYRYWPLTITGLFMFVGYLDRINIAVAAPTFAKALHLDPSELGLVFSVFLVGYCLMPWPAGYLADKIGARKVLSFATGWFAVFSGLTAIGWNFVSLFVIRLLFGIGEGTGLPASLKANQNWSATHQRGVGSAIYLTGVCLGGALAPLFTVAIIASFGWRAVFYIMAIPGVLVALLVWFYLKDRPQEVLSESEIARSGMAPPSEMPVSRALMYRSWSIWALYVGFFLFNVTYWGLALWVPSYFAGVRHVNLSQLGIWSSLPWAGGLFGGYAAGWIGDIAPRRKYVLTACFMLAGICSVLTYTASSGPTAVAFLTVGYFFMIGGAASIYSLMMVLVGAEAAGAAMGSMYFFGILGGVVAPSVIGFIVQNTHSYAIPFGLMGGGIFVGGLVIATIRETRIDLSLRAHDLTAATAK